MKLLITVISLGILLTLPAEIVQAQQSINGGNSGEGGLEIIGGGDSGEGGLEGLQPRNEGGTGYVPVYAISGLTDALPTQGGLANFLNNLYKYLVGIAAILAVIEIIWGGLEISTQDSVSKNQDGKKRIKQALGGLLLVLSPALVFSLINPSILNLSLNLPPLDTKPLPISQSAPKPTQCDSSQLTPEQKQACETVLNARQEGLLNLTPEQREKAVEAGKTLQQISAEQQNACKSAGGQVYAGSIMQKDGQCTPLAIREAQRGGYATCTVLADGSVCFSK